MSNNISSVFNRTVTPALCTDKEVKFSDTLILFIIYSKSVFAYDKEVRNNLLEHLYLANMDMESYFHVLLTAYIEFLNYPQFQIKHGGDLVFTIEQITNAPFDFYSNNDIVPDFKDKVSLKNYLYSIYIAKILSNFSLCNIGWCKKQLGLEHDRAITITSELFELAKKGLINA